MGPAIDASGRYSRRRGGWLSPGVLLCLLAAASAAGAGETAPDPGAVPGTSLRLTLFNDSLNLGVGVVAALFGYDRMDGDDEGYTHGAELSLESLSGNGDTHTWALGSRLFIRRQHEPVDGAGREEVPIWFTEEESLSYTVDTRRRGGRSFVEYGVGALYEGKTTTAAGASGQQRWFHRNFNTSNQTTYRYEDDGKAAWGVFVHGGYGLQGQWPLGDSGAAASALARFALEPNTLADASQLILAGAASLSQASAASKVALALGVEAAVHPGGLGYRPSVELAYERRGWGIRSSVAFPRGDLRNHTRYDDDRDPISSLSVFVRFAR